MSLPSARRPVVLITGASAGIGAAWARVYAEKGWDLILTARREGPLNELGQELTRLGAASTILVEDLADAEAPRRLFDAVTERGLIDVVVARDNLQALRAVGHQVLIDDFGTGYCSLAYLQTLPVDCLKIDKSFIDALGHDAASSGVAPHIIRMAHDLHLRVIAEGIECEDQAVLLNSEGVNYGQGWLFAHPLNARQFIELVIRGRYRGAPPMGDEA